MNPRPGERKRLVGFPVDLLSSFVVIVLVCGMVLTQWPSVQRYCDIARTTMFGHSEPPAPLLQQPIELLECLDAQDPGCLDPLFLLELPVHMRSYLGKLSLHTAAFRRLMPDKYRTVARIDEKIQTALLDAHASARILRSQFRDVSENGVTVANANLRRIHKEDDQVIVCNTTNKLMKVFERYHTHPSIHNMCHDLTIFYEESANMLISARDPQTDQPRRLTWNYFEKVKFSRSFDLFAFKAKDDAKTLHGICQQYVKGVSDTAAHLRVNRDMACDGQSWQKHTISTGQKAEEFIKKTAKYFRVLHVNIGTSEGERWRRERRMP